ncbi:hypothetical protein PV327_002893 [Microctonus hyperodae]|uniref:Uncharacterized protein n=1 Tax=Microctonus hyperodae TaxID=165561 RepID=A0AA39FGH6_MICHY|nr:hypothetical protein PV327_002893 [Microctonus hyperodae]
MKLVLFLITLISSSQGQILNVNWVDNLMGSINQLNRNIQSNVQMLNRQIQNSVKQSMIDVDMYNQNIAHRLHKIRVPIPMSSMSNGQTVILNSGTGGSQFVLSGYDTKGVPYYRAIEQAIINNVLKHIERIYNSTTDKFDIFGYTLDLADPKSKPIPIGKAK